MTMTPRKPTKQTPPNPPPPPFKTRDIDLASALIAAGCILVTHTKDVFEGRERTWFVFEDCLLCVNHETSFWKKELPVDALSFALARKELLTRAKGGPKSGA